MTEPGLPEYLTADQIADEQQVHLNTVRRWFRTGGLRGRKVGHSWRTTRAEFDRWLLEGESPDPDA